VEKNSRIFVAGHRGLVGSAICRELERRGFNNVVTTTKNETDLKDWSQVAGFFANHRPEYVFLAAAKVGGIAANAAAPVDFLQDNLLIQTNVMQASYELDVKKLLFLGSACAYPKHAECPIKESALLTGPLEPSNAPYALAKIAGITLAQSYAKQYGCRFISAMPTNLYGPGDHYDLENSHVLPGMVRRIHEAKTTGASEVTLWGSGNPTREFLFSDDLARACLLLMEKYDSPELINIGFGEAISLRELANKIRWELDFHRPVKWDTTRPDGTPLRSLDSSKIFNLGWRPIVSLEEGLRISYEDFLCRKH
jgi:GDP-L-fucose synthase